MNITLPYYAQELFKPYRYKCLYGGRGSGKSYSMAKILLCIGRDRPIKVLCAREYQNSIQESVHSLLTEQIDEMGFNNHYTVKNSNISGKNGTEFIFKGVRHNVQSIKSMQGVDILWLEEADTVSQVSWDILIPTIRNVGSEIWVSYNPNNEDDPTHKKFVNTEFPPEDSFIKKVNWTENKWFPSVLVQEKDHMFKSDPDLAMHVWEGECRTHSDAQIFKHKWSYEYFDVDPSWDGPYFGADWGFSVDPTVLIKIYIDMKNRNIMIRSEQWGLHVELDDLPAMFDKIPEVREYMIRSDCSRPETISYIDRQGFSIIGARKWKGSVEDGIEWLKSWNKIIIHTDCPHMKDEAKNYSYKVDRLTSDITVDVVDNHNHCWDAVRYALEPMISAGNLGLLDYL